MGHTPWISSEEGRRAESVVNLNSVTHRRGDLEPPVPSNFGTPDARWLPKTDHDAVHVAALNLQHLLLCELRRRSSGDLTADLSQLLGVHVRKAQRIVAGDQMLTFDEVVEVACLLGDEVLAAMPHTVADLFPEAYRPLLLSWRAGERELPRFGLPRVPVAIAWPRPVAEMSEWLAAESRAGRLGLINERVIAHRLAGSLADGDIPSSLIIADRSNPFAPGWLGLDVLTRTPTRILVCCLLDPVADPVRAMRDIFSATYELLARDGVRVALLCIGQRMSGQLQVHLPDLTAALIGDTLTVGFQLAGELGVPAATEDDAPDLTLTLEATATNDHGMRVLAVAVGKDG